MKLDFTSMKKARKWIQRSVEGSDGNASSRKLTTFSFTAMFIVTWFVNLFMGYPIDQGILLILGIVILVGNLYLTAQNIVDILKRPSSSIYSDEVFMPSGRKDIEPDDPERP